MKVKRENILCRRNSRHKVIGPVGDTASEEAWESGAEPSMHGLNTRRNPEDMEPWASWKKKISLPQPKPLKGWNIT